MSDDLKVVVQITGYNAELLEQDGGQVKPKSHYCEVIFPPGTRKIVEPCFPGGKQRRTYCIPGGRHWRLIRDRSWWCCEPVE